MDTNLRQFVFSKTNLDEEIKNTIVNNIVDKVKERLIAQVDTECNNKIAEQMENIEKTVSE